MTDADLVRTREILADYLDSFARAMGTGSLAARLEAEERAKYAYLPDPDWMRLAGYESVELGIYHFSKHGDIGVVHKVRMLSQTPMVLLFRDAYFVAGQLIESDEQLAAFLQQHRFEAPSCE